MSCTPFEELLDCPAELLEPQETQALAGHLFTCPSCQHRKAMLDAELAAFQHIEEPLAPAGSLERFLSVLPPPGVPAEVAAVQALAPSAALASAALASAALSSAPLASAPARSSAPASRRGPGLSVRGASRWMKATVVGAVMMAGLVAFSFSRGISTDPAEGSADDVRFKGQPVVVVQPSVDLQTFTEQLGRGGATEVHATVDRDMLSSDEGLLFTFQVQGGAHLLLMERSPEHVLKVLYQRQDLVSDSPASQQIEIVGDSGRLMRYRPSGPQGEYTYVAVLSSHALSTDPTALDAYWSRYLELQDDALSTPQDGGLRIDAIRVQLAAPARLRNPLE
ncbi:MAG: hypothetical protein ACKO6N_28230 [Myxococcota bacterium]